MSRSKGRHPPAYNPYAKPYTSQRKAKQAEEEQVHDDGSSFNRGELRRVMAALESLRREMGDERAEQLAQQKVLMFTLDKILEAIEKIPDMAEFIHVIQRLIRVQRDATQAIATQLDGRAKRRCLYPEPGDGGLGGSQDKDQ